MTNRAIHKHQTILAAITLGGLVLRLAFADRSLWVDEFFSVYWVKRGLAYIWGPGLLIESNPPLYYTLLLFWTRLFGFGEIALRLPTLFASAATIPIVYLIGARLFDRRTALIAAALFAINPVQIGWADEARSYGLQTFLAALCLLAVMQFFSIADRKIERRKALVLYAASAAALGWTHYAQTYFIAACAIVGLIGCIQQRQTTLLKEWLIANLVVFASTAPEIPIMLKIGTHVGLLGIRVAPADVPGNIAIMLSGTSYPVLATFVAGIICFWGWQVWQQQTPTRFLTRLIIMIIPGFYIALLFIGNFFNSVLVARVLVVLAVPAALIFAKLITDIGAGLAQKLASLAIVLVYAISLPHELHATPFRQVFADMAAQYQPGDMVVFGPFGRIGALDYYQKNIFDRGIERWRPVDEWPVTDEDRFWSETFSIPPITTAALQDAIAHHHRVWLIQMEDNLMTTPYRQSLSPSPTVFFADKLLHVYLWRG